MGWGSVRLKPEPVKETKERNWDFGLTPSAQCGGYRRLRISIGGKGERGS